jgi:serine protease Do
MGDINEPDGTCPAVFVGGVVAQIDPDGAAARKGLRPGAVILEAAGQPVMRPTDVQKALLDARKEGRKAVLLRVKSGNTTRFVALAAAG